MVSESAFLFVLGRPTVGTARHDESLYDLLCFLLCVCVLIPPRVSCREERNVTKKAVPLLKEAVQSIRNAAIEGESAFRATIHSVSSCEGSVTLVINRGKVRPGFELEVKCEWSLAASSPSASGATETTNSSSSSSSSSLASGTISIPELSDSDGAAIFSSFQCTCTEAQAPLDKAKAKALASEVVKKTLREKLREWVESVKSL